jgi:hypothetical protein
MVLRALRGHPSDHVERASFTRRSRGSVSQVTPSLLARLVDGFRLAVKREPLLDLPETLPSQDRPTGLPGPLRSLFAAEALPLDGQAPSVAQPHRGLASMLFAADPLPADAPVAPSARHRWLGWLFLPERIDDHPPNP